MSGSCSWSSRPRSSAFRGGMAGTRENVCEGVLWSLAGAGSGILPQPIVSPGAAVFDLNSGRKMAMMMPTL